MCFFIVTSVKPNAIVFLFHLINMNMQKHKGDYNGTFQFLKTENAAEHSVKHLMCVFLVKGARI